MAESIVRKNLLTRPGYAPYCGTESCPHRAPRTRFDGEQFVCSCGWRSSFDAEFIAEYKQRLSDRQSAALYNETMRTP